ncbi:hypothetical protein I4U23_021774 [Adineta vaga]|nr:hypothetical protein I4U23_021774 [Adineta vaga]
MNFYISIFIITIIVIVNSSKLEVSLSRIEHDSHEITKLIQKSYTQIMSSNYQDFRDLLCRAVNDCCLREDDKHRAMYNDVNLFRSCSPKEINMRNLFDRSKCELSFNRYSTAKAVVQNEPIYFLSETVRKDSHRQKRLLEWFTIMSVSCIDNEYYVYYCQRDNYEQLRLCQMEVLKQAADLGSYPRINYTQYLNQLKEDHTKGFSIY